MEFSFTEEQTLIRDTVFAFFSENATSERTRKAMAEDGLDRDLWTSFCNELGLGGAAFPENYGGAGLGQVEFAILAEAAGAQVAALPLLSLAAIANAILAGGSDNQKNTYLPKLLTGDVIGSFAISNDIDIENGKLTGKAQYLPHGGIADIFMISTVDNTYIIEKDAPGVTINTHTTMDQTRPLATLTLDNASTDEIVNGSKAMQAAQSGAWLCLAAEALGGAQASLDHTVKYSIERVQFGRPIGSFQAYKHRLADMMVQIEQLRSAVYWAAAAIDSGSDEAQLALHSAKSFGAETFHMCAANMIQLHGGIGFTWEHDAHLYFKRARSIMSLYGHPDWHREKIATLILGEAV